MTIRERLLGIPELNIEQSLLHMRGGQLDEYLRKLEFFIDKYPPLESELKKTLDDKDYFSFSGCLSDIRDMLIQIRADELAEECLKLTNGLAASKHEKVEARMTFLLSLITMLSIDIQMAVYKDEDEDEEESEEQQLSDGSDEHEIWKKSILAVDDSVFFLEALKKTLLGADYKLTCVNSGISALRFLQNHDPDLFILDIEMPEMDGYELARNIRAYGKKAPIFFLTGNATREYVIKAIKAGAADFIVKPITQKQVVEKIDKLMYPSGKVFSDAGIESASL